MTPDQVTRLKPLLVAAYWRSRSPREFALLRCLWLACGLGDPIYGEQAADFRRA